MPFKRWTRTNFFVLAALMWLGVGVVAPVLMTLNTLDSTGDSVEASPSDSFSISQPIVLVASPLVRLERGSIAFVDSSGKVLTAAEGSAANSGAHIRLFNAVVSISGKSPAGLQGASTEQSPFATALAAGRYDTLSLRRTTVFVNFSGDAPEAVTDVKADISLRRRGHVSFKGTGLLRGRPVTLDAIAGLLPLDRKPSMLARVPAKFTLKGEQIDVAFDGRAVLDGSHIRLEGPGEVSMSSGRNVARWLGAYWPAGGGLREVSVRGQMEYAKSTLSFDKAAVRMDGNEGSGVLAMRFAQPRPVLSGTLAYKTFDASPYLSTSAVAFSGDPMSWSSLAAGVLTVPLGMHLDADLRISADRVQLGNLDLGPSAATLALKDGRLLADVTGLKFNGGEGGGQITADFNGFLPKVTVRGKLENIDIGQLSGSLVGAQHIQGRVSIVGDLAGSGATLKGIIDGLAGKLTLRSQSSGKLALDLRGIAAASQSQEISGWQAAARNTTAFDQLDLRLVLRDGTLLTETAEVRTTEATWVATGIVNLLSDRIDVRLTQSAPTTGTAHGPALSVIELKGPLRQPLIKSETVR
jgi:AsmA protein